MTKDQLLAKGISPEVADEIIADFSAGGNDSPLLALNKAVNGAKEVENELFKAEKHSEPDEDDKGGKSDDDEDDKEDGKKGDDEEAYMKKKKEMTKAREILDLDNAAGGVVEMADLGAFLEVTSNAFGSMCKAMNDLRTEIRTIKLQNAETYSLMSKAAAVQVVTSDTLEKAMGVPQGRRGVTTLPVVEMEKSSSMSNESQVYATLTKAMKTGDQKAGFILSAFESTGKRLNALDNASRAYISQLLNKGE